MHLLRFPHKSRRNFIHEKDLHYFAEFCFGEVFCASQDRTGSVIKWFVTPCDELLTGDKSGLAPVAGTERTVGPESVHGVAVSADGDHALASAFTDRVYAVDLSDLVVPDPRPTGELVRLGELA
jgi:hypothetical protein